METPAGPDSPEEMARPWRLVETTPGNWMLVNPAGTGFPLPDGPGIPLPGGAATSGLPAELLAQRKSGVALELVVSDPLHMALVALGSMAPGGWDDVRVEAAVTVIVADPSPDDPEEPEQPENEPEREQARHPRMQAGTNVTAGVDQTVRKAGLATLGKLTSDLFRLVTWYGATDSRVTAAVQAVRHHPDFHARDERRISLELRRGQRFHDTWKEVEGVARKDPAEARRLGKQLAREFPWLDKVIDKKLAKLFQHLRVNRELAMAAKAAPPTLVHSRGIEHRIGKLRPAAAWQLLIDEGGQVPGSLPDTGPEDSPACFVGLLVPEGCPLEPLPEGWHAAECSDLRAHDRVLQTVLDAPVGVFGIRLGTVTRSQADAWVSGVFEVVHGVLRQLPMDGPTRLEVLVEQRGEHAGGHVWTVPAQEAMRQFAEWNPDRARHLTLVIRVIAKDGSPLNGYVDEIAYSWASRQPASKARLGASGLLHACLQVADAGVLRDVWRSLQAQKRPEPALWRALVAHPHPEGSLVEGLLEDIGAECRRDGAYWHDLLAEVHRHLESKMVDLRQLGLEVDFLQAHGPDDAELPLPMSFAWTMVCLERGNHEGKTGDDHSALLTELGSRLFDEAPDLVCQADLLLAVSATNRFAFDEASRLLERWQQLPASVPGLRHHGRVLSSLGQHHAFRGEIAQALARFDQALSAFERLSDVRLARAEWLQTATYRALASLELPAAECEAIRAGVGRLVGLEAGPIEAMACNAAPGSRYLHHLLLRYLTAHGTEEQRTAYLAVRQDWAFGQGHPWPLIDFHRGALLHQAGEGTEAAFCFQRAAEATRPSLQGNGPTIGFMGAVLTTAAERLGYRLANPTSPPDRTALPAAPWAALEALATADIAEGPARMIASCLPFNFR